MEETVVQHLRRIVVDQLGADFLEVIPGFDQLIGMGDGDALDVIHDDHVLGAQIHVRFRAVHIPIGFAEALELAEVTRLHQKIRLGFERIPQFLDHAGQVHHLRAAHGFGGDSRDGRA